MNQHEVEAAALNRIISMLSRDSSGYSWERRAQCRHRTTTINRTTTIVALIFQLASFWYSLVRSVL